MKQCDAYIDRHRLNFRRAGPVCLVVGLDGRGVFSECQLEAYEGIHMAVGNVVNGLHYRPAAGPVGCIKLVGVEVFYDDIQPAGQDLDDRDMALECLRVKLIRWRIATNGIAEVFECVICLHEIVWFLWIVCIAMPA